ncbi:MAG: hypothetical protein PSX81_07650 [bacterium]|nr:hypothetical protein [bacterium]
MKTKITDIIIVNAKINNQNNYQNFMFDTGSPLTYSFKTKDSFNIVTKKLFRLGSQKFDYGSGSINFGNVKFNNAAFLVTDYIMDEYKEVDGLIGSSLLQTSICEINFADSTIKISNELKNFTNLQNSYCSTFDPSEAQGTPIVKIGIGKDTLTAFIDTGFSGLIKLNQKTKIFLEKSSIKESSINGRYFGGSNKDHFFNRIYYKINRLGILGMDIDSLVVMKYPEYYGRNLVGLAFLKKFIVTIDWIHHRIYIKPIEDIHFKQNIFTYGFTCWMQDNQLRVYELHKGSEFEKAGIKSGDVILTINNSTDFSKSVISSINSNEPSNDSIQIKIKNKSTFTLKKNKIFN